MDDITWFTASVAWSIIGFIPGLAIGYVLPRPGEVKSRRFLKNWNFLIGALFVGLAISSIAQGLLVRQVTVENEQCRQGQVDDLRDFMDGFVKLAIEETDAHERYQKRVRLIGDALNNGDLNKASTVQSKAYRKLIADRREIDKRRAALNISKRLQTCEVPN